MPSVLKRYWGSFLLICILLGGWELAAENVYFRLLASSPTLIVRFAITNMETIAHAGWVTLLEALSGLLIATVFSLLFALLAAVQPRIAKFAEPWLLVSQVIPFVCLAPLTILAFGPGLAGKIMLSALMSFFPIVTNLTAAIQKVPTAPLELMRMMGASDSMVIRHVLWPFALPFFFAGVKVAAPFAVIGAIVAEFNGAEWGVGKDIFIAAKRLEPELMMCGILSAALISAALYLVPVLVESRMGSWYRKGES